jgi:hypothetical protein
MWRVAEALKSGIVGINTGLISTGGSAAWTNNPVFDGRVLPTVWMSS